MGTNYYIIGQDNSSHPDKHVGKRSAAGTYCWDCGTTLCLQGIRGVHTQSEWHDKCPSCGKQLDEKNNSTNTGMRELGFHKNLSRKEGVGTCASFTWTKMSHLKKLKKLARSQHAKHQAVESEYGETFTAKQFLELVYDCPIWFQDYSEFS